MKAVRRYDGKAVGALGRSLGTAVVITLFLTALPAYRLTAQSVGRIAYTTYTLPNGLRVVLSQDRSTPIVDGS
jgi:hypothetical protein